MITKKDIKRVFEFSFNKEPSEIKQLDSKQLFIVNNSIIYSYQTIIGIILNDKIIFSEQYYSRTTSRHKTEIRKLFRSSTFIEKQSEFDAALADLRKIL